MSLEEELRRHTDIRLKQAELILKLNQENVVLGEEKEELRREKTRLEDRAADLERGYQDARNANSEQDEAYHELGETKEQLQKSTLEIQELQAVVNTLRCEIEALKQDGNVQTQSGDAQASAPQVQKMYHTISMQTDGEPLIQSAASVSSAISVQTELLAYASRLPQARRLHLECFPELDVHLPASDHNVSFTKSMLSQVLLGGSMQGLIVKVTKSAKHLAVKWDIEEYLCPSMDHNPWAPTKPGNHGFLQVGLGQDRARFNTPEVQHVFVGAGGHFKYHGKYEITRVDPLSVAEWSTLPEKVKRSYSVTTSIKEKHKKHGNPEQVREKYDKGTLFAPCVFLKCIEFDMEFYNDLVIAATAFVQFKSTLVPASPTESSPQKRKRPASREVNGDAAGEKSSAARNKKARPSVPELDSSPEEIEVTKTRRKSARISQMARNSPAPTGYDSDGGVSSALTYLPAKEDD